MADTNSDDDLVILSETRCSHHVENVSNIPVNVSLKSDDESEECQILDDQQSDGEGDDLIVLDSIENGTSSSNNNSLDEDSDSEHLEVVAEVPVRETSKVKGDFSRLVLDLQHRIKTLEEENLKLKDELKESTIEIELVHDPSNTKLLINDKVFDRKYRSAIETFIAGLVASEKEPTERHLETPPPSSSEYYVDKFSGKNDKSVDTDSWSIPLYEQTYNEPLLGEFAEPTQPSASTSYSGLKCFNCGENHRINSCTEPIDRLRILQNKKKFQINQSRAGLNSKRYHLSTEFDHIKPGELSEDLRSALDLKANQLPLHIYRMRVLGYPPGWMKEAEVETSGISLYDSDGKVVVDLENIEDGELDAVDVRVQYDPRKLISYPGFNIPAPSGFIDEHKIYGMPSIRRHHSRSEMEKTMKPPDPYKKRKSSASHTRSNKRSKNDEPVEEDMEVESLAGSFIAFQPPLPDSPIRPRPPLPPTDSTDEDLPSIKSSESPTLTDLEDAKQKLMQELEDASGTEPEDANKINSSSSSYSRIDGNNSQVDGNISQSEINSQTEQYTIIDSISDSDSVTEEISVTNVENQLPENGESPEIGSSLIKRNCSLSMTKGTPILESHCPFSKLPDSASFAKGVAEHLPFENLPSSTGSYDKMRKVLSKVRERVQQQ